MGRIRWDGREYPVERRFNRFYKQGGMGGFEGDKEKKSRTILNASEILENVM